MANTNNTLNGGLLFSTFNVTSNLTLSDGYYILFVDTSSAISLTLPPPTLGRVFIIKDKSGQAEINNITLLRNNSEKIEGISANRILSANWGKWKIVSDGTDWFIV